MFGELGKVAHAFSPGIQEKCISKFRDFSGYILNSKPGRATLWGPVSKKFEINLLEGEKKSKKETKKDI